VSVTASVGIAMAAPGETADSLLAQADIALYRAKTRGRARYELFDETMRARALRRVELEADLRRAITLRALRVLYQPQIAIATGAVAGFEALVRWEHPELGALEPQEFVALAEDTGLITPLGAVVLAEALAATRTWHEAGVDVPVAVNLSGRQLDEPGLADAVARAIRDAAIDPSWLTLEITESALTEPSHGAMECLDRLRGLGIRLAMDDFGTGSSSLAALRTLPVHSVKLDRRFQSGIESDPAARAVVAAVLQLVHALGLSAVAEGVESAEQLAALEDLGCELVQGYFLAPAMEADAVVGFCRAR
jgi:predicted signal transduction protein with EAL and GGDEF domain